jgi:hypothetical protein
MTMSRSRVSILAANLVMLAGGLQPAVVTAQDPDSAALQRVIQTTAPRSVVRVQLRDARVLTRPLAATGVASGGYDWGEERLLTLPLGAGMSFGANGRWRAEARWHHLAHHGSLTRPTLVTISAGRRLAR